MVQTAGRPQNNFHKIRSAILAGLNFIAEEDPSDFKQVPWLNGDKWSLKGLYIRFNYLWAQWRTNRRPDLLTYTAPGQYNQWNLLSLYGDLPFPAYYDFDRFAKEFPLDVIKDNSACDQVNRPDFQQSLLKPMFPKLLKQAVRLQCRWATDTFIKPLQQQHADEQHNAIFRVSGHTLEGSLLLSELIRAIRTGVIFRATYAERLKEKVEYFVKHQPPYDVSFADMFFLHHAVWKIWLAIGGYPLRETGRHGSESFFSSPILSYRKSARLTENFKYFFSSNPVSIIFGLDLLSDMGLLNRDDACEKGMDNSDDSDFDEVPTKDTDPYNMSFIFNSPVGRRNSMSTG